MDDNDKLMRELKAEGKSLVFIQTELAKRGCQMTTKGIQGRCSRFDRKEAEIARKGGPIMNEEVVSLDKCLSK
jgi:hypothetical protein